MIQLPDTMSHRMRHHLALASAYEVPAKVPHRTRYRWLYPTGAWGLGMILVGFMVPEQSWMNGFGGNLIAGAIGSVLFVFVGQHMNEANARLQERANARIEALAARRFKAERVEVFLRCLESGEPGDITMLRQRSGLDELLYHARSVRVASSQGP